MSQPKRRTSGSSADAPSRKEILQRCTLLQGLSADQTLHLAAYSRVAFADKGETIWMHGSKVDFVGIVGSGFVKMASNSAQHLEVMTEIMGPGQVFGMLGAISGRGCPQMAKAATDTWYLRIHKPELLEVYATNVVLKDELVRRTGRRLHQTVEFITHVKSGTVEQKVAAVLLLLTTSFGRDGEGGMLVDVPLTRQDISEIAGTTVESTIRVMSRWQKAGLIETRSKHVVIRDADAMIALVRP